MRHVGDGGENLVVLFCTDLTRFGAHRLPELFHLLQSRRILLLVRAQNQFFVLKQTELRRQRSMPV